MLDGLVRTVCRRGRCASTSRCNGLKRGRTISPSTALTLELVERFRQLRAWQDVSVGDLAQLDDHVAGLPSEVEPEHEDAKRDDTAVQWMPTLGR